MKTFFCQNCGAELTKKTSRCPQCKKKTKSKKKIGCSTLLVIFIVIAIIAAVSQNDDKDNKKQDRQNSTEKQIENTTTEKKTTEEASNSSDDEIITDQNTEESKEDKNESLVDGLRPEFKQAMDDYEAFYDKYCDLLKRYNANPTDMQLYADYMDMLKQVDKMDKSFEKWDGNLNDKEAAYYIDVNARIQKKLLEVSTTY